MTSKTRIQNYLRENKISELFEEMMGKLIRDLPASPMYYLANFLHDKEKKVKQILRDTTSPKKDKKSEVSENARLWATTPSPIKKQASSTDVVSPQGQDNRKYEKPWLSHTKKSPSKSKSASKLNHTAPISKSTDMKRTEDVVDGEDGVDLCLVYATPKVFGESQDKTRSVEEEMAAELSLTDVHRNMQDMDKSTPHTDSNLSAKDARRKRLEELKRLAEENKSRSPRSQSPITVGNDDDDDDALEVLENADELMSEGVKNPSKTGVIIGRSPDKEKEQIELVLNMSKFFDELGGMEGVTQNQVSASSQHSPLDYEDFESASQVTGPRRPVWDAPDTEVESGASQLNGAQVSKIGIDSFLQKEDVEESGSKAKSPVPSEKSPSPRPRTAPTKSNINLNGLQGLESPPRKSGKSPRSRPTTPKGSRPATPRGSQVGSGRASRRASQTSNLSAKQPSETAKSVNGTKAKE